MSEHLRLAQQRRQLIQTLKDAMADARRFGIRDDLGIAEMQANRLWPDWQSREQVTRQAQDATRRAKDCVQFVKRVTDGIVADIAAIGDSDMDTAETTGVSGGCSVPASPTYEAGKAGPVPEHEHECNRCGGTGWQDGRHRCGCPAGVNAWNAP